MISFDFRQFNLVIQLLFGFYCLMFKSEIVTCKLVIKLLSLGEALLQHTDLLIKVAFFKVKLLLADASVLLVTSHRFLK